MTLADVYSLDSADPADIIAAEIDPGELLRRWLDRPDWMADAACQAADVDRRWFFPGLGQTAARARSVCDTCPVQPACLRYALDDPDLSGIWGGTTERERRRIRQAAS